MARKISIDATGIIIDGNVNFIDLLEELNGNIINSNSEKITKLGLLPDRNADYIKGFVRTTKISGIPPKEEPNEGTYSPLDLDGQEGLGYSNVFLFHPDSSVLLYQFEKNGCYLPTFIKYINSFSQRNGLISSESLIRNVIVLRPGALERLSDYELNKSIEFTILNPRRERQNILDSEHSIGGAIEEGQDLNADELTIKYNMRGSRIEGMPSAHISRLIRNLQHLMTNVIGREENQISKLKVEGYLRDPESDRLYRDEIDLLTDKFKAHIYVSEPRIKNNTLISEKILELESLFANRRSESTSLEFGV